MSIRALCSIRAATTVTIGADELRSFEEDNAEARRTLRLAETEREAKRN
jgi:hypothetical protein